MDNEQLITLFKELNAKVQEAQTEMQEKAQLLIESSAAVLFEAAPEIEKVFWTQYTPYFNDGEPCEFSMHDIYFLLKDDEGFDDYDEGSYLFTSADLEKAKNALRDATEFEADPNAWRDNFLAEYERKWGRPYGGSRNYIRPYPSTVEDAQSSIDTIEAQAAKYSMEDCDRISSAFSSFASAMSNLSEDIVKAIYGDHVKVTISPDGTTVDEYQHD